MVLTCCPSVSPPSCSSDLICAISRLLQSYENPFITATSRSVISDMYTLSRQLSKLDIPRPLAMLYALFKIERPHWKEGADVPLLQGLRIWTDIGDICESESFGKQFAKLHSYFSRILCSQTDTTRVS
jgi:hypothetical protein